MTDNITLRRAAEQARSALSGWANHGLWAWPESALQTCKQNTEEALAALDAALAEPEQKPEPDTITMPRAVAEFLLGGRKDIPAALAEPDATHPGYIIGSHWLETAYSRIAAGEAEADVLAEVLGARGWAKREPAMDEQVAEAYIAPDIEGRWADFEAAFRAAERFHGIRKEDT